MTTHEHAEQALAELGLTEEEAGELRTISAMLIELAYDAWSTERTKTHGERLSEKGA